MINCHCGQCRKWSGHYVAATAAWREDLTISQRSEGDLSWYRSSEHAQRGFCRRCGSGLFWQHDELDTISIYAGTLEGPTGLETRAEIYVEDKGDYYGLAYPPVDTYARSGHNVHLTRTGSSEEQTP